MYLMYKIATTLFLIFSSGFFIYYSYKNRQNKPHFVGNVISAFFLFSSALLIWWR